MGVDQGFGAGGDYINVCQCKGAGYFAEEGGFLVIRLDQVQGDGGSPDFEGESREAGAGTDVEDMGGGQWLVVGDGLGGGAVSLT